MVRQLEQMGAPPEIIEQASKRRSKTECLIHDDCWESVQAFLSLASQWRVVSTMSQLIWLGIGYPSIESYFRLSETPKKKQKQLFFDLLLMQDEALSVINKRNSA